MNLEILIGALSLFSVIALVVTVRSELRGESALSDAFILLCLVVGLYVAIRARRSL